MDESNDHFEPSSTLDGHSRRLTPDEIAEKMG
jgi:hypothetical protein